MDTFARFEYLLRLKNESIKSFCGKIGISYNTYMSKKNGNRELSVAEIEKICDELGIELFVFFIKDLEKVPDLSKRYKITPEKKREYLNKILKNNSTEH